MKYLLLLAGLLALAGCQDSMEKEVRAALVNNHKVLVLNSVELRDLRKASVGESVCGLISYEGKQGRTDFTHFLMRNGEVSLVTADDFQAISDYRVFCSTSQPAA